jgi:hypothetical protein
MTILPPRFCFANHVGNCLIVFIIPSDLVSLPSSLVPLPAGLIFLPSDLVRVLIGFVGRLASFGSTVRHLP